MPFLILLPLFSFFAWQKAERGNSGITEKGYHVMFNHDQHSYLNMALMIRSSGYSRVIPRHRMPGYPILLSLLQRESDTVRLDPAETQPRAVSVAYFERAKRFNIALACLSLLALYWLSRRFLPRLESHLVTWGYAWLLMVFKAPYVQPEAAFYILLLFAIVLLWRLLARPAWWMAPAAALVLAAAFLLKSTVIPLIALFVVCAGIRLGTECWRWWKTRRDQPEGGEEAGVAGDTVDLRGAARGFALAVSVPLLFAAILFPYFRNTARLYGSALWDVHSRHYLWMDDGQEKRFWRSAGIADPDFVAPPGRDIPTAKTYLASHGAGEMIHRVERGRTTVRNMIRDRYRGLYNLTKNLALPLLLILAIPLRRRVRDAFLDHWVEWLLVLGFLGGYSLLYFWYQAIGVGPRLYLALFLPLFFFLVLAMHRLTAPVVLRVYAWQAPLRNVVTGSMLVFVAIGALGVFGGDFWVMEGGR